MRVVTIVPVRSTSTRLPGKVFLPVWGTSMLEHFINRIKRTAFLPIVVLATPWGDLHNFSEAIDKTGISGFQQSGINDADVLSRLWFCANAFNADLIVRANADNPCMDPEMIEYLIDAYLENRRWDMIGTNIGDCPNTKWPQGIGAEVYSMNALDDAFHTQEKSEYREHPHLYFHNNDLFFEPPCPFTWKSSAPNFEVNTEEQYRYIKSIYNNFERNDFNTQELLEYADKSKATKS